MGVSKREYLSSLLFGLFAGLVGHLAIVWIGGAYDAESSREPPPVAILNNYSDIKLDDDRFIEDIIEEGDRVFERGAYSVARLHYMEALRYVTALERYDQSGGDHSAQDRLANYRRMRISLEARTQLAEIGSVVAGIREFRALESGQR